MTTLTDLTINGHIITSGSTPTITGNDIAGTITITTGQQITTKNSNGTVSITGNNPIAGALALVTFSREYGFSPTISLTPTNANGASIEYYDQSSTGSFSLDSANNPQPGMLYTYVYHVEQ